MKAEYIDHLGTDLTVVNAARVSFDKHHEQFEDNDNGLVGYLARNAHFTPFTHCVVTLRETAPIFVARQRFKHQIGFSYNEVSRRYVDDEPEFFEPEGWRKRVQDRKQGSGEFFEPDLSAVFSDRLWEWHCNALDEYNYLLKQGVCPEQARMVLPQSMYTSYYCTGSLAAWARACKQRSDPHSQVEIQDLAKQWTTIIEPLFPVSWKALTQ